MSAEENHYKGKTFEEQVARFLEKRGWTPTLGRHFKGRVAVRKHDCDIFAKKRSGGWTFVAIVCFLLVSARGSYWLGLFSTRLPETPIAPITAPWALTNGTPPGKVISPPFECSIL